MKTQISTLRIKTGRYEGLVEEIGCASIIKIKKNLKNMCFYTVLHIKT